MKNKKRLIKFSALVLIIFIFISVFSGCSSSKSNSSIYILYTNDVHCAYKENIGYDGVSAYKKEISEKSDNVVLVDLGDAIQGDYNAILTKGQFPTDIMNKVGYDFTAVGNHEFDYGAKQLSNLISSASAKYLSCNIEYTGNKENLFKDKISPYAIKKFGNTKVAFIGVSTPYTITSSTPENFMEDDKFVYNFYGENEGKDLQKQVQKYVDETRKKGADYVVLLSHLGDVKQNGNDWFSSVSLIKGTNGIDCVLDGHAHNTISNRLIQNNKGENVILSSSGSKLEGIGQLIINKDGIISSTVVTGYTKKDEEITKLIDNGLRETESKLSEKIGHSDVDLLITGKDGTRKVRNSECEIGNFCADAYRLVSGCDIAVFNGGSIRADIKKGDLTFGDMLKIQPFGNVMSTVNISGEELLDVLEFSVRDKEKETSENGNAIGENGGFLQVSGITFSIDTSVKTPCITDRQGMFIKINEGKRRISNVKILNKDGTYTDIDKNKIYTLASHNYFLRQNGDGYTMFKDNEFIVKNGLSDVQVMIAYINNFLKGNIKESDIPPLGRIIVK